MSANRLVGFPVSRLSCGLSLSVLIVLIDPLSLSAQQYPAPRLTTVAPPGGKVGTKVEVTVNGGDLDEAKELHFSHPSLKARRLPEPKPKVDEKDKKKAPKKDAAPGPIRFEVTIPADAPPGIHDLRVIGKWGISNPRAFVVGELEEVMEKEKNDDVDQAQSVEMNRVVNGVIGNKTDVDYFSFPGKKGQKVVLHCAASSIDSRLSAYLQLFTEKGRELGSSKYYRERDALVSVVLPADGTYLVRLSEFAYQVGGPESFYRLTITDGPWIDAVHPAAVEPGKSSTVRVYGRNLPGAKTGTGGLERLEVSIKAPANAENLLDFPSRLMPRMASLDGFGYRVKGPNGPSNAAFLALAQDPVVMDNENNHTPETAQEVKLPCTICGRIEKRADRDYYVFEAKKGETCFIEAFGDRVRAPVDLFLQLRRVDEDKIIGVFEDHPGLPMSVNRFFTQSDDVRAKFVAPADGRYELLVRSRTADSRAGPRLVYKVSLRPSRPDFRLIMVANHDSGAGLTLRQGSSHELNVICFRQDDFEDEVELTVDGLPSGVTSPPQVLGPKQRNTVLVLSTSSGAADWAGEIRIKGTALIDGKKVTREARGGCLVYPSPNVNVLAHSRLSRAICLAVRDKGPFRLETPLKELAVPVGGPLAFKIKLARQMPDYKDNAQVIAAAGPPQPNGNIINFPKLTLGPDKEGEVKVAIPTNVPVGDYNLVFRASGKLNRVIDKKKKANLTFTAVSPPIRLTVFNSATKLILPEKVEVKPGGETVLPIKLERLHGYKGEFRVELVAPKGAKGISAAAVTIPPGKKEGKLIVKAAKDIKPGLTPGFLVRATAKYGKLSLTEEASVQVAVPALKKAARFRTSEELRPADEAGQSKVRARLSAARADL